MLTDITFSETENKDNYLYIDVRSPKEFEEATIPGAINIPLFDNEERAKIGTVYKQEGPQYANELGIEIVSPKIPAMIKEIRHSLQHNMLPVFFCWRGGMRSKTMATLFDLVYPRNVYRLHGGYRAYREYILERINEINIEVPTFVLHGMTGVGKTLLLQQLQSKGVSIIDLEGLAGHRGSIFGGIGNVSPTNQKTFDSLIYDTIKDINQADAIVIEAESKRVGKVIVPDNILKAKEKGTHILVEASVNKRVERIIQEYEPLKYKEEIFDALSRLEKRMPTDLRKPMFEAYDHDDFGTIVEILLQHYYDPKYQYSTEQYDGEFFEVNSDHLDEATDKIIKFIHSKVKKHVSVSVK